MPMVVPWCLLALQVLAGRYSAFGGTAFLVPWLKRLSLLRLAGLTASARLLPVSPSWSMVVHMQRQMSSLIALLKNCRKRCGGTWLGRSKKSSRRRSQSATPEGIDLGRC